MRHLVLHNPRSQAHLEDLQDRLAQSLAGVVPRPHDPTGNDVLVVAVTQVVRAIDVGLLSLEDVPAVVSSFHLPGFSYDARPLWARSACRSRIQWLGSTPIIPCAWR